jgi:hypothetical protein
MANGSHFMVSTEHLPSESNLWPLERQSVKVYSPSTAHTQAPERTKAQCRMRRSAAREKDDNSSDKGAQDFGIPYRGLKRAESARRERNGFGKRRRGSSRAGLHHSDRENQASCKQSRSFPSIRSAPSYRPWMNIPSFQSSHQECNPAPQYVFRLAGSIVIGRSVRTETRDGALTHHFESARSNQCQRSPVDHRW